MATGNYTGQLAPGDVRLARTLENPSIIGPVNRAVGEVQALLQARSPEDLHCIAQRIEAVILREAKLWQRPEPSGPIEQIFRDARAKPETDEERIASARFEVGDATLWLAAGAEHAPGQEVVPPGVSRAEYFAVLALWKAVDLKEVTDAAMRELRAYGAMPSELVQENSLEAVMQLPGVKAVSLMYRIAYLSSELTKAATLATEAKFFETQLAKAHEQGLVEASRSIREAADHRLREAASLGGRKRAEAFKPAKDEAQKLYGKGSYASRNKAAEDITAKLDQEGYKVAFTTVRDWLKEVDDAIEAKRAQS